MRRLLIIKKYIRAAWIMGFFAALAVYLPNQRMVYGPSELYFGTPISEASAGLEIFGDPNFALKQLNGIKILDPDTGRLTYYFEYIAHKQDTLRRVASLPFLKDNRPSSLACELMNSLLNPLDNSGLTQEERDATSFFWNARADEFTFYECYKSPMKHTLLLSKGSDRILHKVEFI